MFKHDSHRIKCKWSFRYVYTCVVGGFFIVSCEMIRSSNWQLIGNANLLQFISSNSNCFSFHFVCVLPIMILTERNKINDDQNNNNNNNCDDTFQWSTLLRTNYIRYEISVYAVVVHTVSDCMTNLIVDYFVRLFTPYFENGGH